MSDFGQDIMTFARLALPFNSDDWRAYRKWVQHASLLNQAVALWAAQLPTDSPELRARSIEEVLPELGDAAVRLSEMYPTTYARLNLETWQEFVIWCRAHPRYDAEGMPIDHFTLGSGPVTLSKGELLAALDVFGLWLDEEMQRANQTVGEGFNAKTATLPEVAELVGLARGLGAAEGLLRARLDALGDG